MSPEEASKSIAMKLDEATVALQEAMKIAAEANASFDWSPVEFLSTGYGYLEDWEMYVGHEDVLEWAEEKAMENVGELGGEYEAVWDSVSGVYMAKAADFEEKLKEYKTKVLENVEWEPERMVGNLRFDPKHGLLISDYWMPSSASC